MIGGIDSERDLDIYLDQEELYALPQRTVEGILIKFSKPKQQGKVFISLNNSRSTENGFGIGVVDTGCSYNSLVSLNCL